jgi:hypothetical protein
MATKQPLRHRSSAKCVSLGGRNPGPRGGPPVAALSARLEGRTMLLGKPVIRAMPAKALDRSAAKYNCGEDAS